MSSHLLPQFESVPAERAQALAVAQGQQLTARLLEPAASISAKAGAGEGARPMMMLRTDTPVRQQYIDRSWRTVFRAASVKLPFRVRFCSIGKRVVKGNVTVAVATSGNFATCVANALNEYEPGPNGQ